MTMKRSRVTSHLAVLGMIVLLGSTTVERLQAQATPLRFMPAPSNEEPINQAQKLELAMEIAQTAAEAGLFELSMEAVRRVYLAGPPLQNPQIQSSLLGGNSSNTAVFYSGQPVEPKKVMPYAKQLFAVLDVWLAKKAPTEQVVELLQAIVFPETRPNELHFFQKDTSTNENTYEFSFTTTELPRVLAFDLVDLCKDNNSLPALITKLEKYRGLPATRVTASIMLAYARRTQVETKEAGEIVADLMNASIPPETQMPLYCAMTRKIPGKDEDSRLPAEQVKTTLCKMLKQNFLRSDLRAALMRELKRAIAADDQATLDEYLNVVTETVQALPNFSPQTVQYMLSNLYQSVLKECRDQKKPLLAIELSSRAANIQADRSLMQPMDTVTLMSLVELADEPRKKLLRKLLLEKSFVSVEQFGFASRSIQEPIPGFFFDEVKPDKSKQLLPYANSETLSLLDMLLNESELEGKSAAVIDELLAKASENADVRKLLVQWINLRSVKSGKASDEKLSALAQFESESEYVSWWKDLPNPAALELALYRLEKGDAPEEFKVAIDEKFQLGNQSRSESTFRLRRKQLSDKSIVPAEQLQHWVVSSNSIAGQIEKLTPVWAIDENQKAEFLGGSWYGQLLFKYPLPPTASIQAKTEISATKTPGLVGAGVALTGIEGNGSFFVFAPGMRTIGQISGKSAIEDDSLSISATFSEQSVEFKVLDQSISVTNHPTSTFPFLGLQGYAGAQPQFTDVRIVASTAIPREVALLDDTLLGWSSNSLRHVLPPTKSKLEVKENERFAISTNENETSVEQSSLWNFIEGELRVAKPKKAEAAEEMGHYFDEENEGTSSDDTGKRQSFLNYARPLCEGEKFEFEFFHSPTSNNASPAVGRNAYMLRDGKVVLHWITSPGNVTRTGISVTNQAEDPNAQILAPVKLEVDEWNRGAIRLDKGFVTLSINGVDVYRRETESKDPQQFGFFCDPSTDSVRIRKVVLSGDWPTEVPADLWHRK